MVGGVELEGLGEVGLGGGEVVTFEGAGSGEVCIGGGDGLVVGDCGDFRGEGLGQGWLWIRGRLRGLLGVNRARTEGEREHAGGHSGAAMRDMNHLLRIRRVGSGIMTARSHVHLSSAKDDSTFHDEDDVLGGFDVVEGVAVYGDDVGVKTGFEFSYFALPAEEFGSVEEVGLEDFEGLHAVLGHEDELTGLGAVGERSNVGASGERDSRGELKL